MDKIPNKVKVTLANGIIKEGIDVPIEESIEKWSELTLKDGSIIKVKYTVIQVLKAEGEFDPNGNPLYIIKGQPTVTIVSVPENLRKK
jgi:hypothetical protein